MYTRAIHTQARKYLMLLPACWMYELLIGIFPTTDQLIQLCPRQQVLSLFLLQRRCQTAHSNGESTTASNGNAIASGCGLDLRITSCRFRTSYPHCDPTNEHCACGARRSELLKLAITLHVIVLSARHFRRLAVPFRDRIPAGFTQKVCRPELFPFCGGWENLSAKLGR